MRLTGFQRRATAGPAPVEVARCAADGPDREPPERPSRDHFSCREVLSRVGGDVSMLAELIGILDEEVARNLSRLKRSADSGDSEGVRTAAHQISGSVSHFATGPAYRLARIVEDLGERGRLEEITPLLGAFRAELTGLIMSLRQFVEDVRDEGLTG